MNIFLKDLYGKVVCKSKFEDDMCGKYPRIGWVNKNGKRIVLSIGDGCKTGELNELVDRLTNSLSSHGKDN